MGLKRWKGTLIGHRLESKGLDLTGLDVCLVGPSGPDILPRLAWRAYCKLGMPEPGSIRSLKAAGLRLVHAHFATDAVTAWPWLRRLGVPVVVTLHGYDINIHPQWWLDGHEGSRQRAYPASLRAMAKDPRVSFLAVSHANRQRAIDAYGISPEKIAVLHIGVDNELFTPGPIPIGERPPKVLFVGRLVEKKAPGVLIRAMQAVQRQVPAAELVIVGDGPLRKESEQLASDVGANVRFMGALTSARVRELLEEARVFCLPSITAENGDAEGLPISILEAQACGVPVVTSAQGGRDEGILDTITGFAFAEGDHEALAGHLQKVLTDDRLATRMGQAATSFIAERLSLSGCTRALERHYDELARERPR